MKKLSFITFMLISLELFSQSTIILKPNGLGGKDAFYYVEISDGYELLNTANSPILIANAWTFNSVFGIIRSAIDFNWSLIPENATVSNATLKLYANNGDGGSQEFHSTLSGSNESILERIISPWSENTISGINQPITTSTNSVNIPSTTSENDDIIINVTSLVNDILQNQNEGHGFLLKLLTEQNYRRLGFCSSDNSDPNKWPEISITFEAPGVTGKVYHDINYNCLNEENELGLANQMIEIQPGNFLVQTNDAGLWHIDLPPGSYTATLIELSNNWSSSCNLSTTFTVNSTNEAVYPSNFGLYSNVNCTQPNVSIYSNIIRRCFSEQEIYVSASNTFLATDTLFNAYTEVELDPLFTLDSASISFTSIGNSTFSFDLGSLAPSETKNFTLYVTLSCDAVLLETLCHEANLFPAESCVFDTIPATPTGEVTPCTLPWDQSSLSVEGWCANDSIYFSITNTGDFGEGDMECYSPVRIYVDGQLIILDSILLEGGETFTYVFFGTGQTWVLEADQHPLHPGNSHPNAHVELCGNASNWTPEIINNFPQDDADPVKDIFCTVTNGSYDPNDKRGFPTGITDNHFIQSNQDLEYIIRFQNTGTDTAFTVVVRDTLDIDLDITSVILGNISHDYSFRIYGQRILEWTFDNILLVDSTTNEPGSHGFIQFQVKQNKDLPEGTIINNEADIYFDFNEPVITNSTSHIINSAVYHNLLDIKEKENNLDQIFVYPNPVLKDLFISSKDNLSKNFEIKDITGKIILKGKLANSNQINLSQLNSGIYILTIFDKGNNKQFKIVKN
ncbi:MAG: DNRLRE domain-containing protein [Flavobacteriia bacterium]|nr:DNRLRE domain-containing protein [Flavobacteriia bacterium]